MRLLNLAKIHFLWVKNVIDEYGIVDKLITACSSTTYAISGGLVIGNCMNYLNDNAGAFGVILGFITFLAQAYFNWIKHRAFIKSLNSSNERGRRKDD